MNVTAKPIIWSNGGGTQSAAIAVLIAQGKLPVPERCVMADTGREASSTWRYLEGHIRPLLRTVGLEVEVVPHSYALHDLYDTKGMTLVPAFTREEGSVGQTRNFCSGEWKRDVIYRYLREPERGYGPKNPVIQWIGFSRDEIGRCKPSKRKWAEIRWPLIMDYGITLSRQDCVRVVEEAGLPTPPKSRCKICPYMNNEEWAGQAQSDPADHLYAIKFDREIRERDERGGLFLHRSGVPLEDADLTVRDKPEHPLFGRGEACESGLCWT
jgi:hypothetical protein